MYISALANESVSVNIDEWNKTREYIKQMKKSNICLVCEEGLVTLQVTTNTLNSGKQVPCYYWLCDTCGSEYADSDLVDVNAKLVT